jgi:hypothetical protein
MKIFMKNEVDELAFHRKEDHQINLISEFESFFVRNYKSMFEKELEAVKHYLDTHFSSWLTSYRNTERNLARSGVTARLWWAKKVWPIIVLLCFKPYRCNWINLTAASANLALPLSEEVGTGKFFANVHSSKESNVLSDRLFFLNTNNCSIQSWILLLSLSSSFSDFSS